MTKQEEQRIEQSGGDLKGRGRGRSHICMWVDRVADNGQSTGQASVEESVVVTYRTLLSSLWPDMARSVIRI